MVKLKKKIENDERYLDYLVMVEDGLNTSDKIKVKLHKDIDEINKNRNQYELKNKPKVQYYVKFLSLLCKENILMKNHDFSKCIYHINYDYLVKLWFDYLIKTIKKDNEEKKKIFIDENDLKYNNPVEAIKSIYTNLNNDLRIILINLIKSEISQNFKQAKTINNILKNVMYQFNISVSNVFLALSVENKKINLNDTIKQIFQLDELIKEILLGRKGQISDLDLYFNKISKIKD